MGGNPTGRTPSQEHLTLSSDVRARTGAATTTRRFGGRLRELDGLGEARRELARGRGSLTLIDGEAGIGKSRLVAHALLAVGGRRASRIVTIECVEETHAELYPIRARSPRGGAHGCRMFRRSCCVRWPSCCLTKPARPSFNSMAA